MRRDHQSKLLVIFIVAAVGAFPLLISSRYITTLGVTVGIYGIVALGLGLLAGNTRQFSLGQAGFYGVGAYTAAILNTRFGLGLLPCLVASTVAAGLCGYAVGLTSVRLKHAYLSMSTVAFNLVFYYVVLEAVDVTGGIGGIKSIRIPEIAGFQFDSDTKYFYLVWIIVGAMVLFTRNVLASRPGRAMNAIGQDEPSASIAGIDVVRYKLNVFALSAAYAGIAGCLLAFYLRLVGPQPFSVTFSVALLVMIVVGGAGTVWGGLLGAGALTLMPELLRSASQLSVLPPNLRTLFNDYSYHLVIQGIITFVFIVFLPRGLAGLIGDWGARLWPSEGQAEPLDSSPDPSDSTTQPVLEKSRLAK